MKQLVFVHQALRKKSMYIAVYDSMTGETEILGRLLVKPSRFIDHLHDAGVRVIDETTKEIYRDERVKIPVKERKESESV